MLQPGKMIGKKTRASGTRKSGNPDSLDLSVRNMLLVGNGVQLWTKTIVACLFLLSIAPLKAQEKEERPRVCPACGKTFGMASKFCDECGKLLEDLRGAQAKDPISNKDPRAPIPPKEELDTARAALRQEMAPDYAETSAAGKQALALKLSKRAEAEAASTLKHALLLEVQDAAINGQNAAMALESAKTLSSLYRLDEDEAKLKVIAGLAATVRSVDEARAFADECEKAVKAYLAQDKYKAAQDVIQSAQPTLRLAKGSIAASHLLAIFPDVTVREREFAGIRSSMAALQAKPDDPRANEDVGRFYAFIRGDWSKGLPMLVRSKVAMLASVAEADLGEPRTAQEQVILGAQWANLVPRLKPAERRAVMDRGALWIARAMPGLDGMMRQQAERTYAQLGSSAVVEAFGANMKIQDFVEGKNIFCNFANRKFLAIPTTFSGTQFTAPNTQPGRHICRALQGGYLFLGVSGEQTAFSNLAIENPERWEYICTIDGSVGIKPLGIFRTCARKGEVFSVLSTGEFGAAAFFIAKSMKLAPELGKEFGLK